MEHSITLLEKLKQEEIVNKLMMSLINKPQVWKMGRLSGDDADKLVDAVVARPYDGRALDIQWYLIRDLGYYIGSRPWEAIVAIMVWPEYLYLFDCDYKEVEMLSKIGDPVFANFLFSIKVLGTN